MFTVCTNSKLIKITLCWLCPNVWLKTNTMQTACDNEEARCFKNVIGNVIRSMKVDAAYRRSTDLVKATDYSQSHLINEISSNLVPPPSNSPVRAAVSLHKSLNTERHSESEEHRETGREKMDRRKKSCKRIQYQFTMLVWKMFLVNSNVAICD